MRIHTLVLIFVLALAAAACNGKTTTPVPATTVPPPAATTQAPVAPPTKPPSPADTPVVTEVVTAEPQVVTPPLPAGAQRVEFKAEDGTNLVGDYYPAAVNPAPVVVLMHQAGSTRKVWELNGMTSWLNNRSGEPGALVSPEGFAFPALPDGRSYAVFAFDFRTHGESGGPLNETADFLSDAKAALNTVRGLQGVDPNRVIMIGASIGADAAIDICVTGCLGALSLSPGNYLNQPYFQVVEELALDNKPAWCVATQGDVRSAETCQTASGETFRSVIYPGISAHGTEMFIPNLDPDIGQVVLEFLMAATK